MIEGLQQLAHRVYGMIARGVVTLVDDGLKMQQLQIRLGHNRTRDDVEHWQPYGFTYVPLADGEALVAHAGGNRDHPIVIAVADRRYRLTGLADGEVALYDNQGAKVHLKRDRISVDTTASSTFIELKSGGKIVIDADGGEVDIDASGDVNVDATGEVNVTATGAATLKSTTGKVDVISDTGHVTVKATAQDVKIEASAGDIKLDALAGKVSVAVPLGDVDIDIGTGSLDVDIVSGNADILTVSGDVNVKTNNGNATVLSTGGTTTIGDPSTGAAVGVLTGPPSVPGAAVGQVQSATVLAHP